jgi:hypothetical protein
MYDLVQPAVELTCYVFLLSNTYTHFVRLYCTTLHGDRQLIQKSMFGYSKESIGKECQG